MQTAVTKMWPVRNLMNPIDYVTQEQKVTVQNPYNRKQLESFQDVTDFFGQTEEKTLMERLLGYTLREDKTEQRFVSGVNCLETSARTEMIAAKRQWDKEGGIECIHAIQAFAPGEVTPEQAHALGVALARRLWGNRFQVIIATHLDRAHLHNHFIINAVSFADGKRFHYGQHAYDQMRILSDELCREAGLSVIRSPSRGRRPNPKVYAELGLPPPVSNAQRIRQDVDEAVQASATLDEFFEILSRKGYAFRGGNLKYFTIRAPGAERFTRLDKRYGDAYSLDGIVRRISGQPGLVRLDHRPPPRKVRFRGTLPRSRLRGMYLYYCYVIGVFPQKKAYVPTDPAALKKVRMLSRQTRLLLSNHIDTLDQLTAYRDGVQQKIDIFAERRKQLYNRRRYLTGEELAACQKNIEELTTQIDKLRQEVKLCRYIRKRTQTVLQPDRPHSNPEGPEAGAAEPAKKEKQEKHKEFEI